MNKKIKAVAIVAFVTLVVLAMGCASGGAGGRTAENEESIAALKAETAAAQEAETAAAKDAVRTLVTQFGQAMQNVDMWDGSHFKLEMDEYYTEFVSADLMQKWEQDQYSALARQGSSPWPDRIEIRDIEELSKTEYAVYGDVIWVTSVELGTSGAAFVQPLLLNVTEDGEAWKISDVRYGKWEQTDSGPVQVDPPIPLDTWGTVLGITADELTEAGASDIEVSSASEVFIETDGKTGEKSVVAVVRAKYTDAAGNPQDMNYTFRILPGADAWTHDEPVAYGAV